MPSYQILHHLFNAYRRSRRYVGLFVLGLIPAQNCRFTPTCSQYCQSAFKTYGLLKGGWYCLFRLMRCHPFHPGGYDPLPRQS